MSEPIRVLHLLPTLWIGGAENLVLNLAQHADRDRFALHICVLRSMPGKTLQSMFEQLGLPLEIMHATRFYDPRIPVSIARYAQRHRIELIHTHLLDANVIGRAVGRALGRPVVSTLQNEPFSYREERRDRRFFERATAQYLAPQLVAVSEHIRRLFLDQWRISPGRITTINNAVPMGRLLEIAPGVADRRGLSGPLITNIGRLSPQKDQHMLLEAAKIVLAKRPDARFQIVGQGSLEQQLKNHAQALGITSNVTFAGVSYDIPDVLACSDLFVLSSLWEGLPLTAVEAMAAARPIVLTDVGGNRDLVQPGVEGLLVPPGNAQTLAAALLDLLADEGRRRAMGVAGRARVRHDFSIETIVRQYETLYEQMWNNHYRRLRSV